MNVTRLGDEVLITIDTTEAATLAATIDWLSSPAAGPYRRTQAARILQPLADALHESYGGRPAEDVTP